MAILHIERGDYGGYCPLPPFDKWAKALYSCTWKELNYQQKQHCIRKLGGNYY